MQNKALKYLLRIAPKKIVYVSCNPATLARDLQIFGEWFDFSYIQPVDMFPGTLHCECVVSLRRRDA